MMLLDHKQYKFRLFHKLILIYKTINSLKMLYKSINKYQCDDEFKKAPIDYKIVITIIIIE